MVRQAWTPENYGIRELDSMCADIDARPLKRNSTRTGWLIMAIADQERAASLGIDPNQAFHELLCRLWEQHGPRLKKYDRKQAVEIFNEAAARLVARSEKWVNGGTANIQKFMKNAVMTPKKALERDNRRFYTGHHDTSAATGDACTRRRNEIITRTEFPTTDRRAAEQFGMIRDSIARAAIDPYAVDPAQDASQSEMYKVFWDLVDQDAVQPRNDLYALLVGGKSVAQIAADRGCHVSTVHRRLKDTIEYLKHALADRGWSDSRVGMLVMALLYAINSTAEAGTPTAKGAAGAAAGHLTVSGVSATAGKSMATVAAWKAAAVAVVASAAVICTAMSLRDSDAAAATDHSMTALPTATASTPEAVRHESTEPASAKLNVANEPQASELPAPAPQSPKPEQADDTQKFTSYAEAGSVRTLRIEELGFSMNFAFCPGDGRIPDLWVGCTEVTQQQWNALAQEATLRANPSKFRGDDLPVEQVRISDAESFCRELSKRSGKPARLPSQDEWELAALAGAEDSIPYRRRDELPAASDVDAFAWNETNSGLKTHAVATKKANAYNLHDVFGNVFEITTAGEGAYFITGGSHRYKPFWCKVGYPSDWDAIGPNDGIGFRVVMTAGE